MSSSRDPVEVLDQRAQAVAVRGDEHGLVRPQVRHDLGLPVGQEAGDDVLEALGARHLVAEVGVAGVADLGVLVVVGRCGGGGVSNERRQSMNCSSPYSSSVCFLSLPWRAP